MSGLDSSFQSEEGKSMVAEEMEEDLLASEEAAYENLGVKAPMRFMEAGGGFHDVNVSHWWDQKQPHLPFIISQRTTTGRLLPCT